MKYNHRSKIQRHTFLLHFAVYLWDFPNKSLNVDTLALHTKKTFKCCMMMQNYKNNRVEEISIHDIQASTHTTGHVSLHALDIIKCQSSLAFKTTKPLRFSSQAKSAQMTVAGTESIFSFTCVEHIGPPN